MPFRRRFHCDRFKSTGLFNGKALTDPGRFNITKDSAHIGIFQVPGLRNVAVTAPCMSNAMFRTLNEVVQYYNTPDKFVSNSINRDLSLGSLLYLSDSQVKDIVAFRKLTTHGIPSGPYGNADSSFRSLHELFSIVIILANCESTIDWCLANYPQRSVTAGF